MALVFETVESDLTSFVRFGTGSILPFVFIACLGPARSPSVNIGLRLVVGAGRSERMTNPQKNYNKKECFTARPLISFRLS